MSGRQFGHPTFVLFFATILTVGLTGPSVGFDLVDGEPGFIQPGANIDAATLNFLFESATETYSTGGPVLYATVAGHATDDVGQEIHITNGGPTVGVVVAREGERYSALDWALVQVYEQSVEHVRYPMRYWTGPTGTPDADRIDTGDTVCLYGWGNVVQQTTETRPRCGEIRGTDHPGGEPVTYFSHTVPVEAGDSGSPIIHSETGQALGMQVALTSRGSATGWAEGLCSLMDRFELYGYNLTLATAPYDPPAPRPAVPADPVGDVDMPCPDA